MDVCYHCDHGSCIYYASELTVTMGPFVNAYQNIHFRMCLGFEVEYIVLISVTAWKLYRNLIDDSVSPKHYRCKYVINH